jgi:hypothetical protein
VECLLDLLGLTWRKIALLIYVSNVKFDECIYMHSLVTYGSLS